jgi:preprotein translocase subunit YajC
MHAVALFASSEDSAGGSLIGFLPLLLIPVAMYFLMIRPQRRRMREQRALQDSLGVGDEVVTTAGIYGFITGEDGDKFWLEIDDDVQIRVARAAVSHKVDTSTPVAPATSDAPAKDATDASADADADT